MAKKNKASKVKANPGMSRRKALREGIVHDVTAEAETFGLECPVAISARLKEQVSNEVGACGYAYQQRETAERELLWAYRLAESGKMPCISQEPGEGGSELRFRAFINRCGEPIDLEVKAVHGTGDFGEPVSTLMLPDESIAFGGRLVRIRADYLLHLSKFLGKEDYATKCIQIEPHESGGAILVALDGHAMGAFHDVGANVAEPLLLELSANCFKECKGKYNDRGQRLLILDGDHATIETEAGECFYVEPTPVLREHPFPDWRAVVAKAMETASRSGEEPPLFGPTCLTALNFGKDSKPRIRIFSTGPEGPAIVRNWDYPEFLGLVMPLRSVGVDPISAPVPSWLAAPADEFAPLDTTAEQIEEAMEQSTPVQ